MHPRFVCSVTLSGLLVIGPALHHEDGSHVDPPEETHLPAPQPGLHTFAMNTNTTNTTSVAIIIHSGESLPASAGVTLLPRGQG
jgi:hypothetical protein